MANFDFDQAEGLRRMLAGEHMPDQRGKPVYGFYTDPETGKSEGYFDSNRHVAKAPIPVLKHAPLIFGTDGGRQPGGGGRRGGPAATRGAGEEAQATKQEALPRRCVAAAGGARSAAPALK